MSEPPIDLDAATPLEQELIRVIQAQGEVIASGHNMIKLLFEENQKLKTQQETSHNE